VLLAKGRSSVRSAGDALSAPLPHAAIPMQISGEPMNSGVFVRMGGVAEGSPPVLLEFSGV